MKRTHAFLAVSLTANLGLLTLCFFGRTAAPPAPDGAPAKAATTTAAPAASLVSTAMANRPPAGRLLARLGTEGIPALVARLRAAGCPPDVLRAIVVQRFELRREELTLDGNDAPYWKNAPADATDPKVVAALAQLERESQAALAQLGAATEDTDEMLVLRSRRFGGLSDEKIAQIEALAARRQEQMSVVQRAATANPAGTALAEKFVMLEQEEHAALARLLTPDELFEYDMRNGATSRRLRDALVGFQPTEAEYRMLFRLYQAHDAQYAVTFGALLPADRAAREAAQRQMDEQIMAQLGTERFAQYQQAAKPEYQQLNRLVTRLELPLSAAVQVVAVQRDIEERANAVRNDPRHAPQVCAALLAALGEEAAGRLATVIGARGLEGYRQYGGQWLQQLQGRPARPGAKTR